MLICQVNGLFNSTEMFGNIELSESSTLSFHCSVMKMIVNNFDDSLSVNHGINIYMCGSSYYMIHERVNMRNNEYRKK